MVDNVTNRLLEHVDNILEAMCRSVVGGYHHGTVASVRQNLMASPGHDSVHVVGVVGNDFYLLVLDLVSRLDEPFVQVFGRFSDECRLTGAVEGSLLSIHLKATSVVVLDHGIPLVSIMLIVAIIISSVHNIIVSVMDIV